LSGSTARTDKFSESQARRHYSQLGPPHHFAPPRGRGSSVVTADARGSIQKSQENPRSYGVFWQGGRLAQQKRPIFHPLNRLLRILFLVALFRLRAFLLHLSKRFRHVFDLIPNIKTYIDRGALLSRHRDTIAGPCIYLDDLPLLRFVLRAEG